MLTKRTSTEPYTATSTPSKWRVRGLFQMPGRLAPRPTSKTNQVRKNATTAPIRLLSTPSTRPKENAKHSTNAKKRQTKMPLVANPRKKNNENNGGRSIEKAIMPKDNLESIAAKLAQQSTIRHIVCCRNDLICRLPAFQKSRTELNQNRNLL